MPSTEPSVEPRVLEDAALKQLFTPIVRILLRFRITLPRVTSLLESLYIQQAQADAMSASIRRKSTVSQIALATGISARKVAQHRSASGNQQPLKEIMAPEARILEVWSQDAQLRDPSTGRPCDLPIYGKGRSFQSIAKRSGVGGIGYASVLDTLLQTNNASLVADGKLVRLLDPIFQYANADEIAKLKATGRTLYRLGSTLANNVHHPAQSRYQQEIWSFKAPTSRLAEIRARVRQFLKRQNEAASTFLEAEEKAFDSDEGEDLSIVGMGHYYFELEGQGLEDA